MQALRAPKRRIPLMLAAAALAFAAPFAGFGSPQAGASPLPPGPTIPGVVGSVPAVGGSVGDVITTTCGDSSVIVLSVIVCRLELPATTP